MFECVSELNISYEESYGKLEKNDYTPLISFDLKTFAFHIKSNMIVLKRHFTKTCT